MIVTRTNYPRTALAVLFRQKIGDDFLAYDIEVDSICSDKNMIVVREYVNGNIKGCCYYTYLSLLGFIGPVCQVFRTDFDVSLCWLGKFVIDASGAFDSANFDLRG